MSNNTSTIFWEQVEEHLEEDDICQEDRDAILSDPDLASEYLHKGRGKWMRTRDEYIEEIGKHEELEMKKLDAQDQLQEYK